MQTFKRSKLLDYQQIQILKFIIFLKIIILQQQQKINDAFFCSYNRQVPSISHLNAINNLLTFESYYGYAFHTQH